ncbi:Titin-like [Branchiostoma belcheri]|nr:Titin-like [Branchiostoma belcheri]
MTWSFVNMSAKRPYCRVTKLVEGKTYIFRIAAENKFGLGPLYMSGAVDAKLPFDPPAPPTDLQVKDRTKDSMTVSWFAPEDDGGSEITGYMLERRERNSNRWIKVTKGVIHKREVRSTGLIENLEYEHHAFALNAAGSSKPSETSGFYRAVDPVGVPDDLRVIDVTRASVTLSWKCPLQDGGARIVGYVVERKQVKKEGPPQKWVQVHTGVIKEKTLKCKGLIKGEKYEFRVQAKNAAGITSEFSQPTVPILCKDDLRPPKLTLDFKLKEKNTIAIGESFKLAVMVAGKPAPEIVWSKHTEKYTAVLIKNASRKEAGLYAVRASNDSGEDRVQCTLAVEDKPDAPQGPIQVVDICPEYAVISWDMPADDGGTAITNYIVERCDVKAQNWVKVSSAVRQTRIKITKLVAGSAYQFRVFAQNVNGVGLPLVSDVIIAKWPFDPPMAPEAPKPISVTKDYVTLSWAPPAEDGGSEVLGYHVDRKDVTHTNWTRANRRLLRELEYEIGGLDEGHEYEFRVLAENVAGESKPSAACSPVIVRDPVGPPLAPEWLDVIDTTTSTVTLKWPLPQSDGGVRLEGYLLEMRKVGTETWERAHTPATIRHNQHTVERLTEGAAYYFRVSAINEMGASEAREAEDTTVVKQLEEPPEMEIDVTYKKTITIRAGVPLRFYIPISGKPTPACTWEKEDSDLENRAQIETSEVATSLTLHNTDRRDAGKFHLTVENSSGKKEVAINVKVLDTPDTPGKPRSLRVKDVTSSTAFFSWDFPEKDGGKSITRYIVEKREESRRTWSTVATNVIKSSYKIYKLVEGNIYYFRVMGVNDIGIGEPAETTQPITAADPVETCSAPKKLDVVEITDTTVSLSWDRPMFDGGSRITSYLVELQEKGSEEWQRVKSINLLRYTVTLLDKGSEYKFRVSASNDGGLGEPAETPFVVCKEQLAPPVLDLTDIKDTVVVRQGNDFNVTIPFHAAPKPKVTWMRGYQVLTPIERYFVKNTADFASLTIKKVEKKDALKFTLTVENDLGAQSFEITLKVLGKPGKPEGPISFEDVTPESLELLWKPPRDNGGSDVTNYVVEKSDNAGVTWTYVSSDVKRTSVKVPKLTPGGQYILRVSAENRYGVGEPLRSTAIIAKYPFDAPEPPKAPTTADIAKDSVTVAWKPPVEDGGSDIIGYLLDKKEVGTSRWMRISKSILKKRDHRVTNLREGTEYEFRVVAINSAGESAPSAPSVPVRIVDPVSPPTELAVSFVTRASVGLQWKKPGLTGGRKIVSYIIERRNLKQEKWVVCNTENVTATEYTIKGLVNGEKYEFRVSARNSAAVVSPPAGPTIPVLCKDELVPASIKLDYNMKETMSFPAESNVALSTLITGMPAPEVSWTKNGRPMVRSDRVNRETTKKTSVTSIRKAERSDSGAYVVTAKNDTGVSTVTMNVTIIGPPSRPGPVELVTTSVDSITLRWPEPEDDGGTPIRAYTVERTEAGQDNWMTFSTSVRKNTCKVTRLRTGVTYIFRITAVSDIGASDAVFSKPITAKSPFNVPGPPARPEVFMEAADTAFLTWSSPDDDGGVEITGYFVEKKERTSIRWSRVNNLPVSEWKYRVSTLMEGLEYEFRVSAVNEAGVGKPSPPSESVQALEPVDKPSGPINIRLVDSARTTATLSWSKPKFDGGADIVGYIVEQREMSSEEWIKCHKTHIIKETTLFVTGLKKGKQYYFRISAVNRGGTGEPAELGHPVLAADLEQAPDLELDVTMKKAVTFRAGVPIRLYIPISGKPAPEVIWEKEDGELPNRATVETSEVATALIIQESNWSDAGRYNLTLKNDSGVKCASVVVRVLDVPGPAQTLIVKDVTKTSCTLLWEPPLLDGGSAPRSYVVEKRESHRRTWTTLDARCNKMSYKVMKLMEGVTYYFRVMAENAYGIGEAKETIEPITAQDPVDVAEAPSRLQAVDVDRNAVVLKWDKPTETGGTDIMSYVVEYVEEGQTTWEKYATVRDTMCEVLNLHESKSYRFRVSAQNIVGFSEVREIETAVLCKEKAIPPRADMSAIPRGGIVAKAGHHITVDVPIEGCPKPTIAWSKDDRPLNPFRVGVNNTETSTQLTFKVSDRYDTGNYQLVLKNEHGTDTSTLTVVILGPPAEPLGPLRILDVGGDFATIGWKPPVDNGGATVEGYIIEKMDMEGRAWTPVSTMCKRCNITCTELTTGRKYHFRVSAENRFGIGRPLETRELVTIKYPFDPPAAPAPPVAVTVLKEMMVLRWEAPDDGGSKITGYYLERKTPGFQWNRITQIATQKKEFKAKGLIEGVSYQFRLFAQNTAGISEAGEPTEPIIARDPVPDPLNLKMVDVSKSTCTLAWEEPEVELGRKVAGYIVEKRESDVEEAKWVKANYESLIEQQFTVKGLLYGRRYTFRVRTIVGEYTSPGAMTDPIIAREDVRPPSAVPDKTKIEDNAGKTVVLNVAYGGKPTPSLSWTKDDKIVRLTDRCSIDTTATHTKVTIKNCERADSGKYVVTLKNEGGDKVVPIMVNVLDKPGKVLNMRVSAVTHDSATLEWDMPTDDGGKPLMRYCVEKRDCSRRLWEQVTATLHIRMTTITIRKLTKAHEYVFRVAAINMNAETGAFVETKPVKIVSPYKPPSGMLPPEILDISADAIYVSWQPPKDTGGTDIDGYILEYKDKNSYRWIAATKEPTTDKRMWVSGLREGIDYEFHVIAFNPANKPAPPVRPTVTDTTRSTVSLSWGPPRYDGGAPIIGYVMESRKTDSNVWVRAHQEEVIHITEWTACDLKAGAEYYFQVSAVNIAGMSEPAEVTGVVTAKDMQVSPTIELDVSLRRVVIVRAGNPLRLYVPIHGKPTPEVVWTKEGEEELTNRAIINNSPYASEFLIDDTNRTDVGKYTITLKNDTGVAQATVSVRILDTPGKPRNLRAKDVTNYIVERREMSRQTWSTISVKNPKPICIIRNMVESNKYYFRVLPENEYGIGEPCEMEAPVAAEDPIRLPDPPSSVKILEVTSRTVALKWTTPVNDYGNKIQSYLIEVYDTNVNDWRRVCMVRGLEYTVTEGIMEGHEYRFRITARNNVGASEPIETDTVLCKDELSLPVIKMTDSFYQVRAGANILVDVPVTGKPRPTVMWMKGSYEMRRTKRNDFEQTDRRVALFIKRAERTDTGDYSVILKNSVGGAKETFKINVMDKPDSPRGPIRIKDLSPNSVTLAWEVPNDDGGSPITNYLIEKAEAGSTSFQYVTTCLRTTCRITGLVHNREYRFKIMAENKFGTGRAYTTDKIIPRKPFEEPTAPQNAKATSMVVNWAEPEFDGGSPIIGYLIERREKSGKRWVKCTKEYIQTLYYKSEQLIEGLWYSHRVSAVNKAGAGTPCEATAFMQAKKPIDPPGPPGAPEIVKMAKYSVQLKWNDPANIGGAPITGYYMEVRPAETEQWMKTSAKPLEKRLAIVRDLQTCKPYCFRTRAVNKGGVSQPSEVTIVTLPDEMAGVPPVAELDENLKRPVRVKVGSVLRLYVPVSGRPAPCARWRHNGGNLVQTHRVMFSDTEISTQLVIKQVERYDAGRYDLRLINEEGSCTATIHVVVMDKPSAPAGTLKATDVTATQATLSWETPEDEGNTPVTHYVVEMREATQRVWRMVTAHVSTTTYTVTGLDEGVEYFFRVTAENKVGSSDALTIAEAVVPMSPVRPPGAPPSAPEITNVTRETISLFWEKPLEENGAPITGYHIDRREKTVGRWVRVNKTSILVQTYTVTALVADNEYEFRVLAENAAGLSEPSPMSEAVLTRDMKGRPPRPEGEPEVVAVTATTATINFQAPDGDGGTPITGYIIQCRKVGTRRWVVCTSSYTISTTTFVVTGLVEGDAYEFRVLAQNLIGYSIASRRTMSVVCRAKVEGEPPQVLVAPEDCICAPGENARFFTRFSGHPACSAKWFFDGVELYESLKYSMSGDSTNFWLEVFNTTANMEGEYVIKVDNGVGQATASARIIHEFAPRLTRKLPDTVQGRSAGLIRVTVPFKAKPEPTVTWTKDGEEICRTNRMFLESTETYTNMIIKDAKWEDRGEYTANIENSQGILTIKVVVDVVDRPTVPLGPVRVQEVTSNSMLLLWEAPESDGSSLITNYIVEKREPSAGSWRLVTAYATETRCRVTRLMNKSSYLFRIMAQNAVGLSEPLDTTEPVTAEDLYSKPDRIENPPEVVSVDKDSVELRWDEPLSNGGTIILGYIVEKREKTGNYWHRVTPTLITENTYTVTGLIEFSSYQFRIRSENAMGVSASSDACEYVTIKDEREIILPRFVRKPQDCEVREGETGEFTAHIICTSDYILKFYNMYGKELKTDDKFKVVKEPGYIKVQILDVHEADCGEYTCRAASSAGAVTASAQLSICGDPKIDLPEEMKKKINIQRGESVCLKVPVYGDPAPMVTWEKEGRTIVDDGMHFQIMSGKKSTTLTILEVDAHDSGAYTLNIMNSIGEDTATINLEVAAVPDPPEEPPAVSEVTGDSVKLSWSEPTVDGGSPVTGYVVERRAVSSNRWIRIMTVRTTTCTVYGLRSSNEYVFRVSAMNAFGCGRTCMETAVVQTRSTFRQNYDDEVDTEAPCVPRTSFISTGGPEDVYDFKEALGNGEFGSVYRVLERSTRRTFAAVVVTCKTSERKQACRKEIELLHKLNHKRVLRLYDAYESHDQLTLVREFISGRELLEMVIDHRVHYTEADCIHYTRQICEGLEFLHSKNVLHLHLRPESIMCCTHVGYYVKLTDFGRSIQVKPGQKINMSYISAEFVAPEVIHAESIGRSTDMWSLGCIVYLLLGGTSPFEGESEVETERNVHEQRWAFDAEAFDNLSDECLDFVDGLLWKDKNSRYTAQECLEHPWLRKGMETECLEHPWLRKGMETVCSTDITKTRHRQFFFRRRAYDKYTASHAIGRLAARGVARSEAVEKQVTLEVERDDLGPKKVSRVRHVTAVEGCAARIDLKIHTSAETTYSWQKICAHHGFHSMERKDVTLEEGGKYQMKYDRSTGRISLIINNITADDDGRYTCTVENRFGRVRSWTELTVILIDGTVTRRRKELYNYTEREEEEVVTDCPPKLLLPLYDRHVYQGTACRLACVVSWYKDGNALETNGKFRMVEELGLYNLEISDVTLEDAGSYAATFVNEYGEMSTSCTLHVTPRKVAEAEFVKPIFRVRLEETNAAEGDTARLNARVLGIPDPVVFKDGMPIHDQAPYEFVFEDDESCSLLIHNCLPEDSGLYTVKAENSCGSSDCDAMLKVRRDYVKATPYKSPYQHLMEIEDSVPSLVPLAYAEYERAEYESMEYYQARRRAEVAQAEEYMAQPPSTISPAGSVSSKESDRTRQSRSSAASSARRRKDKKMSLGAESAPVFTRRLREHTVIEGFDSQFTCSAEGNPKPKVEWAKDGKVIREDNKFRFKHVYGVLTLCIYEVSLQDAGDYSCTVTNRLGTAITRGRLSVAKEHDQVGYVWHMPTDAPTVAAPAPPRYEEIVRPRIEAAPPAAEPAAEAVPTPVVEPPAAPEPKKPARKFKEPKPEAAAAPPAREASPPPVAPAPRPPSPPKPEPKKEVPPPRTGPVFTSKETAFTVADGEDARLEVSFDAEATVVWKRNGIVIKASDVYHLVRERNTYVLVVRDVIREDTGNYVVEATDSSGTTTVSVNLSVGSLLEASKQKRLQQFAIPPTETLIPGLDKGQATEQEGPEPFLESLADAKQKRLKTLQGEGLSLAAETTTDVTIQRLESLRMEGEVYLSTLEGTKEIRQESLLEKGADPFLLGLQTPRAKRFKTFDSEGYSLAAEATALQAEAKNRRLMTFLAEEDAHALEGTKEKRQDVFLGKGTDPFLAGLQTSREKRLRTFRSEGEMTKPPAPPKFTARPQTKDSPEGGSAKFECKMDGSPRPSVTWFREGKVIRTEGRYTAVSRGYSHSLEITKITKTDSGHYACVANNAQGEVRAEFTLTVAGKIHVEKREEVKVVEKKKKEVKPVKKEEPKVEKPAKKPAEKKPEPPKPKAPEKKKEPAKPKEPEKPVKPKSVAPKFTTELKSQEVKAESIAKLSCAASGKPAPDIIWKKGSETLKQGDRYEIYSESCSSCSQCSETCYCSCPQGSETLKQGDRYEIYSENGMFHLEIYDTSLTDTATYSATVTNEAGSVTTSCQLTVKAAERRSSGTLVQEQVVREMTEEVRVEERVTEEVVSTTTTQMQVISGQEITLKASIPGDPKIKWLHNGQVLRNTADFRQQSRGDLHTLTIAEILQEDAGTYTCQASTRGGVIKCDFQITVQMEKEIAQPDFVSKPSPQFKSVGETVTLQAQVKGDDVKVEWLKDSRKVGDLCTLEIRDAQTRDSGEYSCILSNTRGQFSCAVPVQIHEAAHGMTQKTITRTYEESGQMVQVMETVTTTEETVVLRDDGDERENVHLTVRIGGTPAPKVTWTRKRFSNGKHFVPIVQGSKFQVKTTPDNTTLSIFAPIKDDAGIYKVKVENENGVDECAITLHVIAAGTAADRLREGCGQLLGGRYSEYPERVIGKSRKPFGNSRTSNESWCACQVTYHVTVRSVLIGWCVRSGDEACKCVIGDVDAMLLVPEFPGHMLAYNLGGAYLLSKILAGTDGVRQASVRVNDVLLTSPRTLSVKTESVDITGEGSEAMDKVQRRQLRTGGASHPIHTLFKRYRSKVEKWDTGCIVFNIAVPNKEEAKRLYKDSQSGELQKMLEKVLITDEVRRAAKGRKVTLKVSISEEEYLELCRKFDEDQQILKTRKKRGKPVTKIRPFASDIAPHTLTLTWHPPEDDGGSLITSYAVEMFDVSDGKWQTLTTTCRRPPYPVKGLNPSATYRFRIRAENAYGVSEAGPLSDPILTKEPEQARSNIVAAGTSPMRAPDQYDVRVTPVRAQAWFCDPDRENNIYPQPDQTSCGRRDPGMNLYGTQRPEAHTGKRSPGNPHVGPPPGRNDRSSDGGKKTDSTSGSDSAPSRRLGSGKASLRRLGLAGASFRRLGLTGAFLRRCPTRVCVLLASLRLRNRLKAPWLRGSHRPTFQSGLHGMFPPTHRDGRDLY